MNGPSHGTDSELIQQSRSTDEKKGGSRMARSDGLDLQTLIAPLSLQEFFEDYWEKKPLVRQHRAERYGALLEVSDVEFLTASLRRLDAKWIRLVNSRHSGPMREFQQPGGGLSMERILEAYREGTTVVLNDLQQRWPSIRDLTRRLWHDFNSEAEVPFRAVGANAYLSPPNAQGLSVHFDTHCVFVLQLTGRKAWTLYDAWEGEPPPAGEDRPAKGWLGEDALKKPLHEVVLEAGDFIYIPRGLAHKAETVESRSLHLAVGLYPYTWGMMLEKAIRTVPGNLRSLPRGIFNGQEPASALAQQFSGEIGKLLDQVAVAAGLRSIRAEIERSREGTPSDRFERDHAIEEITQRSRVERRSTVQLRLQQDGDKVVLDIGGRAPIQLPSAAEPALRYILENEAFSVSSLPDVLSENSKKVLVRRLLRERVLELVSAADQ